MTLSESESNMSFKGEYPFFLKICQSIAAVLNRRCVKYFVDLSKTKPRRSIWKSPMGSLGAFDHIVRMHLGYSFLIFQMLLLGLVLHSGPNPALGGHNYFWIGVSSLSLCVKRTSDQKVVKLAEDFPINLEIMFFRQYLDFSSSIPPPVIFENVYPPSYSLRINF